MKKCLICRSEHSNVFPYCSNDCAKKHKEYNIEYQLQLEKESMERKNGRLNTNKN